MAKTEIISFRDFMDGSYSRKPDYKKPLQAYSLAPLIPHNLFGTMFGNEMSLVMLGVGAVFIIIAVVQKSYQAKGQDEYADYIGATTHIIAQVIGTGLFFWLISKSAKLFL